MAFFYCIFAGMIRLFSLSFLILTLIISGCSVRKARIQTGAPNIESYKSFDNYHFSNHNTPFCFDQCPNTSLRGEQIFVNKSALNTNAVPLREFLENTPTVAFAIIRNDSVLYEYYEEEFDETKIVTSFSVAKSFVSAVLGIAIHEGYIQSVEEPITRYLPELSDKRFENIRIRHVLNHVSGIQFPSLAWTYYTHDNNRLLQKMKYGKGPGKEYVYANCNTLLITLIIEHATGRKFQDYFHEKIWSKIGTEYEMLWSMDNKKDQNLKTFCCINGRMRDFAKFGKLYLQRGKWNDEQIIPSTWIDQTLKYDLTDGSTWDNEYFWYLGPKEYGYYYAAGLYGQYILIYPKKNIIILRFAKRALHFNFMWQDQLIQILDQL